MLKNKNEVFNAFKQFKAQIENQTGRKIKCLQSNNGKEYINREFEDFLKKEGIRRRLTVTHSGVERSSREEEQDSRGNGLMSPDSIESLTVTLGRSC